VDFGMGSTVFFGAGFIVFVAGFTVFLII